MARPTRRSAEVRAREASAEREAARLRASGMALIDKGRFFGGAGVFESAKAARKFRLPLLPRDPRRPRPTPFTRPTKKWESLLKAAAKFRLPLLPRDESAKAARKFRLPLLPRDPRRPRPTKKWKSLLKAAAKFCDESVESDHATMELAPNFISATIADDDEGGWEVLVLGYEWRRGRPKFKYIIIERENDKDSNPNTKTATRGGGGAVDGVQD